MSDGVFFPRDLGIEADTQLLCGRDAQAGGFVLGLHVQHGHFAALTNCRCRVLAGMEEVRCTILME